MKLDDFVDIGLPAVLAMIAGALTIVFWVLLIGHFTEGFECEPFSYSCPESDHE